MVVTLSGSPPRMRGKVEQMLVDPVGDGITPAHAGKRHGICYGAAGLEDHPRACGEKPRDYERLYWYIGSPPRMRGKAEAAEAITQVIGITPAHAGKSTAQAALLHVSEDHPRACGEKSIAYRTASIWWGSPPRMRGKVRAGWTATTPLTDHPRACGEKKV